MAQLGNKRRFYLGSSLSGSSWTWLAGEQNNSFNKTAESIEVSDKSTEWQQFISGKKGATASVTVFTDDTSSGPQHDMISALHSGETVFCFIGVVSSSGSTGTPSEGDAFEAIITEIADTNDQGSVATRQISLTATGEVKHYPTVS